MFAEVSPYGWGGWGWCPCADTVDWSCMRWVALVEVAWEVSHAEAWAACIRPLRRLGGRAVLGLSYRRRRSCSPVGVLCRHPSTDRRQRLRSVGDDDVLPDRPVASAAVGSRHGARRHRHHDPQRVRGEATTMGTPSRIANRHSTGQTRFQSASRARARTPRVTPHTPGRTRPPPASRAVSVEGVAAADGPRERRDRCSSALACRTGSPLCRRWVKFASCARARSGRMRVDDRAHRTLVALRVFPSSASAGGCVRELVLAADAAGAEWAGVGADFFEGVGEGFGVGVGEVL